MSLALPRFYRHQLRAVRNDAPTQWETSQDKAVAEAVMPDQHPGATAAGDSRKLRGIPAIGRSVRGAVPGTTPGEMLWR